MRRTGNCKLALEVGPPAIAAADITHRMKITISSTIVFLWNSKTTRMHSVRSVSQLGMNKSRNLRG
jgi:hypothetical protein